MANITTWSLLIFAASAVIVWIYQAIILPCERQRLRFKLFKQRDELRELVICGRLKEESAAFRILHSQINLTIKMLPRFDWSFVQFVKAESEWLHAERRSERFQESIRNSIPEVQALYDQMFDTMLAALVLNSVPLLIQSLLPALVSHGVRQLWKTIKHRFEDEVEHAIAVRERDVMGHLGIA